MTFLIEYDRRPGHLVRFESFQDDQYDQARATKLAIELDLRRRGIEHEVVLLTAESKAALLRTHRRYFATAEDLVSALTF